MTINVTKTEIPAVTHDAAEHINAKLQEEIGGYLFKFQDDLAFELNGAETGKSVDEKLVEHYRQRYLNALRGLHQALSHHVGMLENMVKNQVPVEDQLQVQALLKKDRETCIQDGQDHAQSHFAHGTGNGPCPFCTH